MGFFGVINQAPRLVHSIIVVFEREAVDLTSQHPAPVRVFFWLKIVRFLGEKNVKIVKHLPFFCIS